METDDEWWRGAPKKSSLGVKRRQDWGSCCHHGNRFGEVCYQGKIWRLGSTIGGFFFCSHCLDRPVSDVYHSLMSWKLNSNVWYFGFSKLWSLFDLDHTDRCPFHSNKGPHVWSYSLSVSHPGPKRVYDSLQCLHEPAVVFFFISPYFFWTHGNVVKRRENTDHIIFEKPLKPDTLDIHHTVGILSQITKTDFSQGNEKQKYQFKWQFHRKAMNLSFLRGRVGADHHGNL